MTSSMSPQGSVVGPLQDVRDISKLAYGFMASKCLFVALELDIFSRLASERKTLTELANETGIADSRLRTLLTTCVSLGLLSKSDGSYANAPAAQEFLVRSSPRYFGDYYRFQIDRQIYPLFARLADALRGERINAYELTQDSEEAEHFSRAQHSGSMGPAAVLSKLVDLKGRRNLLDVAGGSGAFSITLCQRNPSLTSTILDFPAVEPVARHFVDEARLSNRVRFLAGDALEVDWPADQDVLLMSYLLSAVGATAIPVLLGRAFHSLTPGGLLIVHDFMVDDDGSGPTAAALWMLFGLLNHPDAVLLTPSSVSSRIQESGLVPTQEREIIPTITRMVTAVKAN